MSFLRNMVPFIHRRSRTRLEAVYPEVYKAIKRSSLENAKKAYCASARTAFSEIFGDGESAAPIKMLDLNPSALFKMDFELLAGLRDAHEETYFEYLDKSENRDEKLDRFENEAMMRNFSLARFYNSLVIAIQSDSKASLIEAVYELIHSCEEPKTITNGFLSALVRISESDDV